MRVKTQAVDDVWGLMSTGCPKKTIQRLTGVATKTMEHMTTVRRKLLAHDMLAMNAGLSWREASRAAISLGTLPPLSREAQALRLAGKLRKAMGNQPAPVDVLATAVTLLVDGVNLEVGVVRGVRNDDQTRSH